jgi:hypothetical protein
LSAASAAGLNIAGFKGSWKLLLALVVIGTLMLFPALNEPDMSALIFSVMCWAAAIAYWRWRR